MAARILIADDEKNIREGLRLAMIREGYDVVTACDGQQAWDIVSKQSVDMVITDLRMPEMDGNELLSRITHSYPLIPVVVLTGHGTIEEAVAALHRGAKDFLTKPPDIDHLAAIVSRSLANRRMEEDYRRVSTELEKLKSVSSYTSIIGNSQKVRKMMETIEQIAPSKINVLITGESGVGKERAAEAIVKLSDRKDKPFVTVHCASLNPNVLESELFGHVKGAYTGATSDRVGRFEEADGGTIFLDEIGEIDMNIQQKLLRAIENREITRMGSNKTIKVDVRIISATNRNLQEEIKKGNFRQDIYFRLNGITLEIPPLRERKEDLSLFMASFLDEFNRENNKSIVGFTPKAQAAMSAYSWPGNVRELRNCMQRAVVLCRGKQIDLDELPPEVSNAKPGDREISIPFGTTMDEAKKIIIHETIDRCGGNKSMAAKVLDIGKKTVFRLIKED